MKRFGTMNPAWDRDSGSPAIVRKGQLSMPFHKKHLWLELVAGLGIWWIGERCLRSWEDGKNFRWIAKVGNEEKRPWAADSYSLLPNPGGLQKAGGENQAESEVKWNRGVMLTPTFKSEGGLRSVSGPGLEAKQEKLSPIIHLLLWSSSEAATPTAVWCGPWTLGFQH